MDGFVLHVSIYSIDKCFCDQAVAERYREIDQAVSDLIRNCPCTDGCPGCVGAAGENGIGGKAEALAICQGIGGDLHE